MTCEHMRELMNASIDGSIQPIDQLKLEKHLDSCESCTVEFEDLKCIASTLEELTLKPLPEDFEESLRIKLRAVVQDQPKKKVIPFKKRYMAATGVAAVLLFSVYLSQYTNFKGNSSNDFEMMGITGSRNDMNTSSAPMESFDYGEVVEAPAMEPMQNKATFTAVTEEYRQDRMIIKSASISLDVEKYDDIVQRITTWTTEGGGYVENLSTSLKTNYTDQENLKYGYITLRIPTAGYDSMLSQIKALGNVTNEYSDAYDVTKAYRDTAAEIENLKLTEARFREILSQAQDVNDILSVENELTRIRGQINQYTRQIKDWEALVDMTTITISLNEVKNLKPVIERIDDSLWGRAKDGFIDTINGIKNFIEHAIVWLISSIPLIVIITPIAYIAYRILKRRFKR